MGIAACSRAFPARRWTRRTALQVVLNYRIAAENLRQGLPMVDPRDPLSLPYVMEMAEAQGRPVRLLPIFVISPLKLAGESLSAVLDCESRLQTVVVASMPAAGCSAPVRPAEAFALAAAEIIGAALILRECLRPRVEWAIGVFPFGLRGWR